MATRRGYYREELRRAIRNIEMALNHLARIIEAFKGHDSQVYEIVNELGDMLVIVGEKLQELHDSI